jgi:phosphonate transport system substrate-binding protein
MELALQKQEVHLAWLGPVEYMLASKKGCCIAIGGQPFGVTAYGVQFLGHKDADFTAIMMPAATITAPAATALAQFAGLTPCLTTAKSLPGYWVPLGYLAQNAVAVQNPVLTRTYSAGIRAVYIKGICDFTANTPSRATPAPALR